MKWYTKYLQVYNKSFSEIPQEIVSEIHNNLKKLQSENPLVTVSLIGYNEEKHLLACLWSLSEMQCKYPIEIIGVDNESQDRTAEIFEATGVTIQSINIVVDMLVFVDLITLVENTTLTSTPTQCILPIM